MKAINKLSPFYLLIQFFMLVFITSTVFSAPAGTIAGKVTDGTTGEGLPGANISIVGTSMGAATNLKGDYRIPNVPPGEYMLRASFIGYQEMTIKARVQVRKTTKVNFALEFQVVKGKEIVVTAQASGQLAAINRQLTSRQIVNVVSAEKMQELPDANAAEALGRLPGISLKRNSGEANKVVVRGLAPKYNNVTIEGVKMASTNDFDRSVDLSLIQGEMLGGVEVSKTLRPDMDADALGGTINLRLKEADPGWKFNLRSEGGHVVLNNSWKNYKVIGNASNRFFNNKFGVRLELSAENKNLPSQRFGGSYSGPIYVKQPDSVETVNGKKWNIRTQGATLTDQSTIRARYGGSLIMDYKSNWWDIKFFNLYNRKGDNVIARVNKYNFVSGGSPERFNLGIGDDDWTTDTRTNTLQNVFKFAGTQLHLNLSTTFAEAKRDGQSFNFVEVGDPGLSENWLIYREPVVILKDYTTNIKNSYLQDFNLTNQKLTDESYDVKLDYDIPFRITKNISGKFSIGGKYHQLKRDSDGLQRFSSFQWGGSVARRQYLLNMFPWIETDIGAQRGINADNFVDSGYDPGEFLKGRYTLGWSADIGLLTDMQSKYYTGPGDVKYYKSGVPSYERDYTANEDLSAGYVMAELNVGKKLMVLPGVRFEKMNTKYRAFHIVTSSNIDGIEPNPDSLTTTRSNSKWFPSVNFKYDITKNSFIQGAVYKSTSRPDFRQISPLVIYSSSSSNITSNNPYLKPSSALNLDLGFSIFSNKVGLLSVYGYYKEIDDLIFYMRDYFPKKKGLIVGGPKDLDERILGPEYYLDRFVINQNGKVSALPFNNPERAYFRGVEFSWQTNFWYLPGLLKGLVLDVNFSLINSETHYPYFESVIVDVDSSGFIPRPIYGQRYQTRKGAMQDQPKSILNLILGWDYKGFSSRISYRYQDKTLQGLDTKLSIFDRYYDSFSLFDLMLRQKIFDNLSVYANLTNIGNHIDDYFIGAQGNNPALPTSSQHYGSRAQFGITFRY